MSLKIDVRDILADHFGTLRTYPERQLSWSDIVLFYLWPLVVGVVLVRFGVLVQSASANVLITALAIFAGLLFNLLLLAHSLIRAATDDPAREEERELLREIFANISYAILVSLVCLVVLLVPVIFTPRLSVQIASAVSFFLLGNFLLTLLMILKRVHVMLSREFEGG